MVHCRHAVAPVALMNVPAAHSSQCGAADSAAYDPREHMTHSAIAPTLHMASKPGVVQGVFDSVVNKICMKPVDDEYDVLPG